MRHISILFLLCMLPYFAFGEDLPNTISYFCNEKNSEISIGAEEQSPNFTKPGFVKKTINWSKLLKMGPQKNGHGDPLRTGSKIAIRKCGMIQMRMESGFLNSNPQGESGAMDFLVIELRIAERTVLSRTALDECAENDERAKAYFGTCPNSWAQSIRTKKLANGSVEVEVKRKFENENYQTKETIENKLIYE